MKEKVTYKDKVLYPDKVVALINTSEMVKKKVIQEMIEFIDFTKFSTHDDMLKNLLEMTRDDVLNSRLKKSFE